MPPESRNSASFALEEFTNCMYRHRTTLAAHDQLYWLEPGWPHLHLRHLELNGHLRAVDS
jgi:hypothetical protein